MNSIETSNLLTNGLIQRINSSNLRFSTGLIENQLGEETISEIDRLISELFISKSQRDAWKILLSLTGELPTFKQVEDLYVFSHTALDLSEFKQGILRRMILSKGMSALAEKQSLISCKTVVLFESSHILGLNSGIQRVARMIARSLMGRSDVEMFAVMPDGSGFTKLTNAQFNLLTQEGYTPVAGDLEIIRTPDVSYQFENCKILFPDVSKDKEFSSRIRALGAYSTNNTFFIGYDLIPILASDYVDVSEIDSFSHYLLAVSASMGVICISEQTKNEFRGYLNARKFTEEYSGQIVTKSLPISHTVLKQEFVAIRDSVLNLDREVFALSVGTIGSRKNQLRTLLAFRKLWKLGKREKLVLIGRVESSFEIIYAKHFQKHLGKELLHFTDVSDDELAWLYEHAMFTIQISEYEGFGLPVIESISHGKPVITNSYGVQAELAFSKGGLAVSGPGVEALYVSVKSFLENEALRISLQEEAKAARFTGVTEYVDEILEFMNNGSN
jgi:glycosyltransferase involved in cell wall biosynthesis